MSQEFVKGDPSSLYFRLPGRELRRLAEDGDRAAKAELARRKANRALKRPTAKKPKERQALAERRPVSDEDRARLLARLRNRGA